MEVRLVGVSEGDINERQRFQTWRVWPYQFTDHRILATAPRPIADNLVGDSWGRSHRRDRRVGDRGYNIDYSFADKASTRLRVEDVAA